MFIYYLHGMGVCPRWIIGAPCLNIANGYDIWIFLLDGIIEAYISAGIV